MKRMNKRGDSNSGPTIVNLLIALFTLALIVIGLALGFGWFKSGTTAISTGKVTAAQTACAASSVGGIANPDSCAKLFSISDDDKLYATCNAPEIRKDGAALSCDVNYVSDLKASCERIGVTDFTIKTDKSSVKIANSAECEAKITSVLL